MLQRFGNNIIIPLGHQCVSWSRASLLLCMLVLTLTCKVHAQEPAGAGKNNETRVETPPGYSTPASEATGCLPGGDGYLRARLSGALRAELVWGNEGTECTGAVRPTDGGIRMRFSRAQEQQPGRLVLVFGIAGLREGASAKALPVNLTVIREGAGEFYSTRGDDKCMLDEVRQEAIVGIPRRSRSYRIIARGFCTEPARAVQGTGAVLLSRFDFAGRVDFETEAPEDDQGPDDEAPIGTAQVAARIDAQAATEATSRAAAMNEARSANFQ